MNIPDRRVCWLCAYIKYIYDRVIFAENFPLGASQALQAPVESSFY